MAREYEKLTNDLNEKARDNFSGRDSSAESALSRGANRLKLVQDEEQNARSEARMEIHTAEVNKHTAQNDAWRDRMTNEPAHHQLINQLSKEEEARSMAVQRMEEAERRLQLVQFGGRQALPAMHEELMELRQRLKQQEQLHMRAPNELRTEAVPTKGMTKAKGRESSMILPTATVTLIENTTVVGNVATRDDPFSRLPTSCIAQSSM